MYQIGRLLVTLALCKYKQLVIFSNLCLCERFIDILPSANGEDGKIAKILIVFLYLYEKRDNDSFLVLFQCNMA